MLVSLNGRIPFAAVKFTFISGVILSGMWFKQVIPCRQFKRLENHIFHKL